MSGKDKRQITYARYLAVFFVMVLGIMAILGTGGGGASAAAVDVSGAWEVSETVTGNCTGDVYPIERTTVLNMSQSGSDITVTLASTSSVFSGTISGSTIKYSGKMSDGTGTTSTNVTGTVSDDGNSFSGNATWTWTDGTYTCSGKTSITATRIMSKPAADVTGTWEGTWQSNQGPTGTFSADIVQQGSALFGSISVPYIGLSNAKLKGTINEDVIVFGDIDETITFTGTFVDDSSALGTYVLPSFDDNGSWQATKTGTSTEPTVTITAPNGGETWAGTHNITWITTGGNPGSVEIRLSSDSGENFSTVIAAAAPDTGSYSWDTTSIPNGTQYRVQVAPTDMNGIVGIPAQSSADFSINNEATTVTLTSPVGGEVWAGTQLITWTNSDSNPDTVEIRLSSDFGASYPTVIAAATADTGSYSWDTTTVADGTSYRIQIIATDTVNNISSPAQSLANFTIENQPIGWNSYPIDGGEMTSIAADPGNSQVVYVGTRVAGVFKTTDGGQSWLPMRTGLSFYPIRSLKIDPQNSNIVYVGTDYDGVWKSTNGGNSWFKTSSGLDESLIVFNLVFDPTNSQIIYAGTAGGVGLDIGHVYKTMNGGETWEVKDSGIPVSTGGGYVNGIQSLAIDQVNPALLYAGTTYSGAFRSTDGGVTWDSINTGLPFLSNSTSFNTVSAIAIDPYHNNRPSATAGGGYYGFDDNTESWQKISQGVQYVNPGIGPAHLYFHPSNSSVIYSAGGSGGFTKSSDAGANWIQLLGHPDSGRIPDITFNSSSPDTIYAASDVLFNHRGGVYKSENQGATWTKTSQGITAIAFQSVDVDPKNSNFIYAGTGQGHLYRTEDGGATWDRATCDYPTPLSLVFGFRVSDIMVDPSNSQNVYVAAPPYFFKSTDKGVSFNKIENIEWPQAIAIPLNVSNTIYVGSGFVGYGIYKSTDGGVNWTQKNAGLPLFGGSIVPMLSLEIDPNNPSVVWAGTQYGGGIVKTTDGGENWQTQGLTSNNFVEAIAVNPDDSNVILVGAGNLGNDNIYKSTDGGTTWPVKISNIGLVQDIKFDPRNSNWVYAATEGGGVLRSTDGGETWRGYDKDIFYPVNYSLAISNDDPPLLVTSSFGSGLYWNNP